PPHLLLPAPGQAAHPGGPGRGPGPRLSWPAGPLSSAPGALRGTPGHSGALQGTPGHSRPPRGALGESPPALPALEHPAPRDPARIAGSMGDPEHSPHARAVAMKTAAGARRPTSISATLAVRCK